MVKSFERFDRPTLGRCKQCDSTDQVAMGIPKRQWTVRTIFVIAEIIAGVLLLLVFDQSIAGVVSLVGAAYTMGDTLSSPLHPICRGCEGTEILTPAVWG